MTTATRPRRRFGVAQLHRWVAIALSPVLVLILLSGIVLAFRPIVERDVAPPQRAAVDWRRLVALVDSVDPGGHTPGLFVDDDAVVHLGGPRGELPPRAIATGRVVATSIAPSETSIWDIARRVHVTLWIGAEGLVTLATLAMIFLVVAGPFLARPRRPRTARGWHVALGWASWPLLALLPFSVVMMKLHPPIRVAGNQPAIAPTRAIEHAAAAGLDLSTLRGIQSLPGGTAIVMLDDARGFHRYVLNGARVRSFDTRVATLGHALHEGTWAGPWSGALNVLAALASLTLLGSGLVSWWGRRARRRRGDGEVPGLARAA